MFTKLRKRGSPTAADIDDTEDDVDGNMIPVSVMLFRQQKRYVKDVILAKKSSSRNNSGLSSYSKLLLLFHQGLHCLLRLKQPSGTEIHHNLDSTCDPLKY